MTSAITSPGYRFAYKCHQCVGLNQKLLNTITTLFSVHHSQCSGRDVEKCRTGWYRLIESFWWAGRVLGKNDYSADPPSAMNTAFITVKDIPMIFVTYNLNSPTTTKWVPAESGFHRDHGKGRGHCEVIIGVHSVTNSWQMCERSVCWINIDQHLTTRRQMWIIWANNTTMAGWWENTYISWDYAMISVATWHWNSTPKLVYETLLYAFVECAIHDCKM